MHWPHRINVWELIGVGLVIESIFILIIVAIVCWRAERLREKRRPDTPEEIEEAQFWREMRVEEQHRENA